MEKSNYIKLHSAKRKVESLKNQQSKNISAKVLNTEGIGLIINCSLVYRFIVKDSLFKLN